MDSLALNATEAERLIRQFAAQGDHRTGSPGDDACTLWLIDELSQRGIDAEAQPYSFPRLTIERAELTVAGRTVPGTALYDGGFTPLHGVQAKLIEAPSTETPAAPGAIALWYREPGPSFFGPGIYDPLQVAHEAGTLGVVIVAGDDQGDPVVRNAERIDDPLPIPVLQVAPRDVVPLQNAATATLTVDATRQPGSATNVVAAIPGSDPDAAPVVLMTPFGSRRRPPSPRILAGVPSGSSAPAATNSTTTASTPTSTPCPFLVLGPTAGSTSAPPSAPRNPAPPSPPPTRKSSNSCSTRLLRRAPSSAR